MEYLWTSLKWTPSRDFLYVLKRRLVSEEEKKLSYRAKLWTVGCDQPNKAWKWFSPPQYVWPQAVFTYLVSPHQQSGMSALFE